MAAEKLPAIQFYPGDWLSSREVRLLSAAARGVWIDLLCLMWNAPRRGYLEAKEGVPMPMEDVSILIGVDKKTLIAAIAEMEQRNTYSVDSNGVLFCRRMVRDEERRAAQSEVNRQNARFGKLGGRPRKNSGEGSQENPGRVSEENHVGFPKLTRKNPSSSSTSVVSLPSVEIQPPPPSARDQEPEPETQNLGQLVDDWIGEAGRIWPWRGKPQQARANLEAQWGKNPHRLEPDALTEALGRLPAWREYYRRKLELDPKAYVPTLPELIAAGEPWHPVPETVEVVPRARERPRKSFDEVVAEL